MINKQNVIILDGPDCCGKTNIAHAISDTFGIPYFKNSLERDTFGVFDTEYFTKASRYIDTYMSEFLFSTRLSVVFDRNYPSEYVYPMIFGRTSDREMLRKIDDMHCQIGTKIIVPYRSSYEGIVDPVHPQIDSDALRLLDELYQQFCGWTSCDVLRLNVDDEDIGRELEDISKFLAI